MAKIYIDPTFNGTSDGSINNPFKSWSEVSIQSNNEYFQKCGTEITVEQVFMDNKDNITIGAYGEGERPIIIGNSDSHAPVSIARSRDIIVKDLNLKGVDKKPVGGVYFRGHWNTGGANGERLLVENCEISHCYNGVRCLEFSTAIDTVTIRNCHIYDISEDGVFIKMCDNVTVEGCDIHDVNTDFWTQGPTQQQAPGDCVQLSGDCDNFKIYNNIMDRRSSGLKFCFIHNSSDAGPQPRPFGQSGEIIGNTFYPPYDQEGIESAGGAIYLRQGENVLIRDNYFSGEGYTEGTTPGAVGQMGFQNMTWENNLVEDVPNAVFTYNANTGYYVTLNMKDNTFVLKDNSRCVRLNGVNEVTMENTEFYVDNLDEIISNNNSDLTEINTEIYSYDEYENVSELPTCTTPIYPENGAIDVDLIEM